MESIYRFHPVSAPFDFLDLRPARLHSTTLQGVALGILLASPPIARAIGIPAPWGLVLFVPWTAWAQGIAWGRLGARAQRSLAWMRALTTGNLLLGTLTSAGLAAATGRPDTPLWALPVMYACFNGASIELEASILCLGAHVGSVLLAIPILIASGVPVGDAIATPVVIAATCAIAYHFLAARSHVLRLARAEAERLRAQLDQDRAALARARLARDLHDAVGANLAAAAAYADLLAGAESAAARTKLADAVAESARQGLVELRGLLEGLAPDGVDAGAFGEALRACGSTIASASGLELIVEVEDPAVAIGAEPRLAMVRVFQESLQNAIKHARATRFALRIACEGETLRMTISDDGRGFDVARTRRGRGLRHVEERATEIGGRAEIRSGPGGTRITIEIPGAVREEGSRERVISAQG